ncbi:MULTISPECIES: TolC family protein [unclassified Burkholderia]|uniref:TolC family protein n=1 Tax=unclassified Burkholderia TaxID=2613784 RepID=UPI000F5A5B1E|nr:MULTISPECIES: TolC family protein [unclassified Burkholderia]RQS01073.1 TolC family protein [Burkholderia sp. Bp8991]RQS22854.1 TolC family protein [Burkholderia sp. Bp8995]RQS42886.1 TolC family protein [Burkholderia sp. Bp8989]
MKRPLATVLAVVALAVSAPPARAQLLDVYGTRNDVAATPAGSMASATACGAQPVDARPLALEDAILLAICSHPQLSRTWSDARAAAAEVGVSKAAYWPTLNATAGVERDNLTTNYSGGYSQDQRSTSRYGMLNLSWVLFDFGKRGATLDRARALLRAANAAHDDALQSVFYDAAQAFYALRDAQAALAAAQAVEHAAQESLAEASARHDGGAGTLGDALQAQTTYRKALLDRVSAEGDLQSAIGTLATTLGADADTPLRIADAEPSPDRDDFTRGVADLIAEAKRHHPKLIAAREKLEAAHDEVRAVRAQSLPTISLTGSVARNNPSYQQQASFLQLRSSHSNSIGIQVSIPLFEGFASGYRVAQAKAQADAQEADVRNTELKVSLDVWKSYQSLQTDTTNLDNSRHLLDTALHSLDIARGRYKAGVGTFTELLNAQSALADARRQRVLAVSKWRIARLKLAESLGRLGLWNDAG